MIVTLHGADIAVLNPSIYPFYTDYLKGRILFAKSRSIYRLLADDERFHVVTVSNSEKRNLEKNIGIPEEKISVVYNGVDHQKFRALKNKDEIIEELRLKYGIPGKFVFHLSSFHPKKNVPTLLRAFQSLKKNYEVEHKLVLCGPQDKYSRKVSPLVSLLNLNKDVSYIGYIPETDLPKFYNAADFFAFPSLHESFGLPILEAMASGCPVLTSKAYSMPEIAGNSAVLINPSDAQEIADAMYEMTVNHKLRQDCRRKGLERAKLFTWKKCAEEYVRIYKKFCTG